jgi:hypothetical protein
MRFPKSRVARLVVRLTYTHNHRCRLLADDVSTRYGRRFEATTDAAVPQLRHGHVSGRHYRAGRCCSAIARLRMPTLLCWFDAIATRGANQCGCCPLQGFALIGHRDLRSVRSHAAKPSCWIELWAWSSDDLPQEAVETGAAARRSKAAGVIARRQRRRHNLSSGLKQARLAIRQDWTSCSGASRQITSQRIDDELPACIRGFG